MALKTFELVSWTFSTLLEKVQQKKLKLDAELFQRNNIANDDWSKKLVKSFVEGKSINTITIAELNREDSNFSTSQYTIYKELNLDGLQRISALLKFNDNKIPLPAGTTLLFKDNNNQLQTIILNKDRTKEEIENYYSTNNLGKQALNKCFHTNTLEIRYHKKFNVSQCNDEFIRLNSSNPLNNQEIRNAINNDISITIRRIARGKTAVDERGNESYDQRPHRLFEGQNSANKYMPSHLKFNNLRFNVDEETAKALIMIKNKVESGTKLNKTNIDAFYKKGSYTEFESDIEILKQMFTELRTLVMTEPRAKLLKKHIQALPGVLYLFFTEQNRTITDHAKFFKLLIRAYDTVTFQPDSQKSSRMNEIDYGGDHGEWVQACYEEFTNLLRTHNRNNSIFEETDVDPILAETLESQNGNCAICQQNADFENANCINSGEYLFVVCSSCQNGRTKLFDIAAEKNIEAKNLDLNIDYNVLKELEAELHSTASGQLLYQQYLIVLLEKQFVN